MAMISLDNGNTYMDAKEAMEIISEKGIWNTVALAMDDELREEIHSTTAPSTDLEFLEAYLKATEEDLIIG